jgi:CBS domain-containing protein
VKVKERMTPASVRLSPNATLREARAQLRVLERSPWLPVCDGDRWIGVVTRQDIALVADGLGVASLPVRHLIPPDVEYCFEDTEVDEAVRLMHKSGGNALPVLSRNKRLVGVLHLRSVE